MFDAYLHVYMETEIYLCLTGTIVELLTRVNLNCTVSTYKIAMTRKSYMSGYPKLCMGA